MVISFSLGSRGIPPAESDPAYFPFPVRAWDFSHFGLILGAGAGV